MRGKHCGSIGLTFIHFQVSVPSRWSTEAKHGNRYSNLRRTDAMSEADATAAVMLMETFDRLTRKEKYVWDVSIDLFEL